MMGVGENYSDLKAKEKQNRHAVLRCTCEVQAGDIPKHTVRGLIQCEPLA